MEEFLRLLNEKKVDVKKLTTHTFPISEALKAYAMISGKSRDLSIGVLLEYTHQKTRTPAIIAMGSFRRTKATLSVGFIGAGNFAQASLLPFIDTKSVALKGVCTSVGLNAKNVARKFGFEFASTDPKEIYALAQAFYTTRVKVD